MGITDKIFDWMKRDSEETSLFQDSPKPSNEDNIINMVTDMLKPGTQLPKMQFKTGDEIKELGGDKTAQALYNSKTKEMIFNKDIEFDEKYKTNIGHELVHYLDDLSVPDNPGIIGPDNPAKWRTDQSSDFLHPDVREKMPLHAFGIAGGAYGMNVTNPQEHISYYTEKDRGDWPENIIRKATDKFLEEHELPGNKPLTVTQTKRNKAGVLEKIGEYKVDEWSEGYDPGYNILDLVKYIEDKEKGRDIFGELSDKYMTPYGKDIYFKRGNK